MVNKKKANAGWMFKKPKRLFPKKYSAEHIPTPRIDHNVAAAYNSQRSRATTGSRGNTEHDPNNNFLSDVPRTRSLSLWSEGEVIGRSERGKVVDTKHELIVREGKNLFELYLVDPNDSHHGQKLFQRMIIEKSGHYKLFLLFNGNTFMFIQETLTTRRISRLYEGRDTAFHAKALGMISWSIVESLSST